MPLQLFDCVQADDLDRALALGLMAYLPDPQHDALDADCQQVCATLRVHSSVCAMHAARYRARAARLQRRAAERDARRAPAPAPSQPALPPLAAAILARAKAKAAGGAQP
ncbi:hypothetical protein FDU21_01725 [Xanthomonas oryzae pv. oryzae]|nr:hypothetical protein FDU21_01725 [Xanthomonas oryzae pv. oryzae]